MLIFILRKVIKEENYSIQAKNLMEYLVADYASSLEDFHQDGFYLHEIKKIRININNRIRKISDLSEIKNKYEDSFYQIIVFNTEYNNLITEELDILKLSYEVQGQLIFVKKKELTFNQLMAVVDEIEKHQNKTLTRCSKAKLEPILRARNAVENDFIDQVISRQTSNRCQEFFEEAEKKIESLTQIKIKKILGDDKYKKYSYQSGK